MTTPTDLWLNRALSRLECRSVVGVQRFRNDTYGHEYHVSICHRWKGHVGACKPHTRHSYIESYYDINRSTWPDMSRRRALWSAWKCWRMTRRHVDA